MSGFENDHQTPDDERYRYFDHATTHTCLWRGGVSAACDFQRCRSKKVFKVHMKKNAIIAHFEPLPLLGTSPQSPAITPQGWPPVHAMRTLKRNQGYDTLWILEKTCAQRESNCYRTRCYFV